MVLGTLAFGILPFVWGNIAAIPYFSFIAFTSSQIFEPKPLATGFDVVAFALGFAAVLLAVAIAAFFPENFGFDIISSLSVENE